MLDHLIRGATIVDGTGAPGRLGTILVEGDTWYHTGTHEGIHFEEVWRRAR